MRVSHEAAGIHCVYWNCRGLAARDARAAVNPRDWMAVRYVSRDRPTNARGISQGARRRGLRRGPERPDRISLGGRPLREAAGNRVGLAARQVAVIVTGGGDPAALAAKAATSTLPIVIVTGSDPVKEGLVPNLNRPGGNITGASIFSYEMESKRLGLLHEAVPATKTIAALLSPANPNVDTQRHDVRRGGGGYWR